MNKKAKSVKEPTLSQQAAQKQNELDAAASVAMEGTTAGQIWNEIKDKDIEMFALPGQKVYMHCHPVMVDPSKLYLLTNSSAVLPSLENAVGKAYVVELADKFVLVSRATK
jgi:hypothetical protein